MATAATKKVIVEVPEKLLEQAEKAAAEMATDRSKLIRQALSEFLQRMERMRFELEMAEAYRANAEFDSRLAEEFDHADADL